MKPPGLGAFVALLLCTAFYADSRPEWPMADWPMPWKPTDGIQQGMYWDDDLHSYVTEWATCQLECSVRGYPDNGDWSDAVTIECNGFEQRGEGPFLFGICCEPGSTIANGNIHHVPRCLPPAESGSE